MDIFQILFYQPTFNALIWFTNVFGSIGWAIIAIALISKLITIPMTSGQIKNAEKTKLMQGKMTELRKKYKNNEEKLAKEMAKLQATALPGQLGGCLSIIIFLVLFLQIRGTILDLVNRGYHAFNEVAYSETLKKKEDFVKLDLPEGFALGEHNLTIALATDNGNLISKTYDFYVTENKEQQIEMVKTAHAALSDADKQAQATKLAEVEQATRAQDYGMYNPDFEKAHVSVPLSQFLFFVSEAKSTYMFTDNTPEMTFYLRAPSNQLFDYSKLNVSLDGQDLTSKATYQQGEPLNLSFAGTNLSRVASDYGLLNLTITLPYILLSLLSGVTQYFVSKLYSANADMAATVSPKPEDHDGKPNMPKKKDEKDEPDFAEAMMQSSKQMNLLFPAFTVLMSLGYFGGASFIPMGVTLFWTAQNTFVIMQQMISQRERLFKQARGLWAKFQERFAK